MGTFRIEYDRTNLDSWNLLRFGQCWVSLRTVYVSDNDGEGWLYGFFLDPEDWIAWVVSSASCWPWMSWSWWQEFLGSCEAWWEIYGKCTMKIYEDIWRYMKIMKLVKVFRDLHRCDEQPALRIQMMVDGSQYPSSDVQIRCLGRRSGPKVCTVQMNTFLKKSIGDLQPKPWNPTISLEFWGVSRLHREIPQTLTHGPGRCCGIHGGGKSPAGTLEVFSSFQLDDYFPRLQVVAALE